MFDHFHLQTLFDRFQNLKPYKYNKHNSKIVEHHGVTWALARNDKAILTAFKDSFVQLQQAFDGQTKFLTVLNLVILS